ncbi:hypothetical protein CMI37_18395 [Candidatus Pacearchaeota archaeon]|nr:hypothetical protein [Candidatus Pacearchaeota archaeon]|tara:strand:+ start:245 stop:616 length:372 start_codon:yes stop_codon:yes gene_type:complete
MGDRDGVRLYGDELLLRIAKDLGLSDVQLTLLRGLYALEKDGVKVKFGCRSSIKRDEYDFAVSLGNGEWEFWKDRSTHSLEDYMDKLGIKMVDVQNAGRARNGNAYFLKDGILVEFAFRDVPF